MPYIPTTAFPLIKQLYNSLTEHREVGIKATVATVNALKAALAEMRRRDERWRGVKLRVQQMPEELWTISERGGVEKFDVWMEWAGQQKQRTEVLWEETTPPVSQDKAQEMLKRMEERLRAEGKVVDLPDGGWRTKTIEELQQETEAGGGTQEAVERMLRSED